MIVFIKTPERVGPYELCDAKRVGTFVGTREQSESLQTPPRE